MATKTFEDETFTIDEIELELNSLTESDPYVDHVEIHPKEDVSFDFIKYSAKKEILEQAKKSHVSGVEFDSMSTKNRDQKMSELPEKIVKIQALINDGKEVKLHTNIGRWTSDDEDSDATTFYITDDQLEDAEVVVDEDSEDEDEESSSTDQDAENQNGSADSNGETEDSEDSTSESSEDDEEESVF